MNFNSSLLSETKQKEIKQYNKFYSINKVLIYDVNINKYINEETFIIEPFYGDGDLLNLFINNEEDNKKISTYDKLLINDITNIKLSKDNKYDKNKLIIKNKDSLLHCLWKHNNNKKNVFIITNPPYTSKNKINKENKERYNKVLTNGINDLYFIFGKRNKLFNSFYDLYDIEFLNIYEYKVFEHTTQSVISLVFINKELNKEDKKETVINIHTKENKIITIDYKLFSDIINNDIKKFIKIKDSNKINDLKVSRAYNLNDDMIISHIKISLLDYNMKAYYENSPCFDKQTDRAYMTVCFNKQFDKTEEEQIINNFNNILKDIRNKTNSLILTSYREFDRKRLSIAEASDIIKASVSML